MSVNIRDVYDLTPLQQGMLFHTLLEPESQLYLEQITVSFSGEINWPAFQQAWQDVADHHDALRTSFHWQEIATPVQVVHNDARMRVRAVDLLNATANGGPHTLADYQRDDRARGFNLEQPPLFRVALVREASQQVCLILSFHHLILDGWSLQVVLRDFATAYAQRARDQELRLPAAGRYRDYLLWMQAQDLDAAEVYWTSALRDLGHAAPLWTEDALTTDPAFGEHEVVFSAATTEAADRVAARCRVTLNTVAQATWALVLGLSTGGDDHTFGITVSGRPAELDGVESMVGLFINTIPLRVRIDPDATVSDWLRDIQHRLLEARQYEFTPLVDVHRWSGLPPGTALFDSIVAFENYPITATSNGDASVSATFAERTNYPLSAVIVPGDRLSLRLLFDKRRLGPATVRRLAERYELLLLALDGDPQGRVGDLPTLTAGDQAIVTTWTQPPVPLPNRTVHENFERCAADHPNAVALEFGARIWTYRELDVIADALAVRLEQHGVSPGDRVAVLAERSAEFVVAVLGTLKAGAAYVPLDPANPPERLRAILDDTLPRLILASEDLTPTALHFAPPTVTVTTDHPPSPSIRKARRALVKHTDPAYVMYTSGSTGEPKGIVVPHRAINRLVLDTDYVQLGPHDRVGHVSNCSFDAATFEIWGPLLNGARIVGIDRDTALTPDRFAQFLEARSVTVLFITTALFNRIAAERPATFQSVGVLMFGGEAVDPKWVRRVLQAGRPARLLHVYGPTECTTFATWHEVDEVPQQATTVPIGRAIANTSMHVLDRHLRPVPIGSVGELYLGGMGLADCYLGRPADTAERFLPDPFGTGERMYRTGDRVRVTPTGVEFVGRIDEQIKLRGYRIEPGEIERTVMAHLRVASCAVVARPSHDGERQLVAYVGSDYCGDGALVRELAEFVRSRLPRYMQPSAIVVLPALPINRNGKIDRSALPDPGSAIDQGRVGRTAPTTSTERRLAAIWCEILGLDRAAVDDDFFEMGGHSLRATQLLSRIQRDLGADLQLRQIFDSPTIGAIARLIDGGAQPGSAADRIVPLRRYAHRPQPTDGPPPSAMVGPDRV